ncbi:MAG: hypothetical protein HYW86_00185 [Candidatus Roizmanbacteria bacterium]|nr:MAG: hypothetical protein HYW86_00185 [Candidatus Roizmanbacteria bacterium]
MSIFILLVFWKIFNLLTAYLAPYFISYLGFFPYKEFFKWSNLPYFVESFANFDGLHYIVIAYQGYLVYNQVFFPLYPLLIRGLNFFLHDYLLSGLLISNLSFVLAILIFKKYLTNLKISSKNSFWIILVTLSFPTAFFFGALYTEGLFFLLFISALYFLQKKNYWAVIFFSILTALTKFIGVFLFVPFAIILFFEYFEKRKYLKKPILFLVIVSPIIGFLIYGFYLFQTTGDFFYFFRSQEAFAGRSLNFVPLFQVYYRYFKILIINPHNYSYFISLFEFAVFNLVFAVLIADLYKLIKKKIYIHRSYRLALNFFSFINLIIPTFTGTLASIPRYALFSLSFFFFLSEIKQTWLKIGLVILFLILQAVFLAFFIQGYFVS